MRPVPFLAVGLSAALATSVGSAGAQNAWDPEGFDLEALAEAARAEPAITVYDTTGKIVEIAQAFTVRYGVQATGTKVSTGAQIDLVLREGQAGNVVGDVIVVQDVPPAMAQLVPMGLVESWMPADLKDKIPAGMQDPLIVISSPNVWTYNTEVHDACPFSNIWELTEPEWARKVAMQDPLGKPTYTDWFSQMETHFDAEIATAYETLHGSPLDLGDESATKQWIRALAANAPLLTDSDSAAGDAVGTRGQAEPFVGMMATSKFRDNAPDGLALGICQNVAPFSGWMYPGVGMIATGTDSPNAARLFLHYLLTEEGIAPQSVDGKISANADVPIHPGEPSGVGERLDQMMPYDTSSAVEDFETRQDWQDFWRLHYRR